MEQARYWMLTKRKHSALSNSNVFQMPSSATSNPSPISSYDHDSWEEQAFAEDAAGGLGGCIWPPRSYSCSFCKREFRSAQALGGHMNVHRRDRARLKQSPTSTSTTPPPPPPRHQQINLDHHHHNNPFTNALFHHYPNPQDICTLVYNNNPNPNKSDPPLNASPTRVSVLSCEKAFFPPFSSSSTNVMQQHHKRQRSSASSPPRSSTDEEELIKNHSRIVESSDHLSVSLNLVVRRARRPAVSDDDEKELQEEDRIYKKRRIDDSSVASLAPFMVKPKKSVEMINLCSLEELDLELRLGQRPKRSEHRAQRSCRDAHGDGICRF